MRPGLHALGIGVGVGWSRDEFAALGVPFAHRGARTVEYVAAMRTLWRDDVASFDRKFVGFDSIRVNPKPVRDRRIPIVVGGNSDPALWRVAAWGDGWYGFNLDGLALCARGSPSWNKCVPNRGVTVRNCGFRWRCATQALAISADSPIWA